MFVICGKGFQPVQWWESGTIADNHGLSADHPGAHRSWLLLETIQQRPSYTIVLNFNVP
jgi:hypothetical protein